MNTIAILDDNQSIEFPDLTKTISTTASYLLQNGVNPNDRIALLSNNSIEYVISIYALWRIDAIPVPINTRLKKNEIVEIFGNSECSVLIRSSEFQDLIFDFPTLEMKIGKKKDVLNYKNNPSPNDSAVIIHTSGSSGKPKGVEITNSNLYQSFLSETESFNFTSDDRFLATLPFYHIGGFAIINRALLSGGTLIIPKSLKQNDIVKSMKNYDTTVVSLVPTMIKRMIESGIKPNSNLRTLFLGGGPSSDELIASAFQNNWPIVKVYGSSETTAMVTACFGDELKQNPASAGRALSNVEIKILDESRIVQNKNIVGEIAIKSPKSAKGYINNSKQWKAKIHEGFYLTGDYGFIDSENRLFVVSRRTDLIVSGGENINPHEVEIVLLKHSQIEDAILFAKEDNEWGEIPVAAIVLAEESKLNESQINAYLKENIASYKIPKKYYFLKELPKTDLGKKKVEEIKKLCV
jgi:O-succinylbenzoic acid--CoA ligase